MIKKYLSALILVGFIVISYNSGGPTGAFKALIAEFSLISAAYLAAQFDFIFTLIEGNHIAVVVAGKSPAKFIANLLDHHIDPKSGIITQDKDNKKRGFIQDWFGIYFIGIWPFRQRHCYKISFVQYKQEGQSYQLIPRPDEPTKSIIWAYPYGIVIPGADTSDFAKLTVTYTASIRVNNANRLLFTTHDWLSELMGAFSQLTNNCTGSVTLDQVRVGGRSGMATLIQSQVTPQTVQAVIDQVNGQGIGIEITALKFLDFMIEDEDIRNAATSVLKADQKAAARVKEASGEAAYITTTGAAEAKKLKAMKRAEAAGAKGFNDAFTTDARAMAYAVKETKATVIGGSVMPTIPITGTTTTP